MHLIHIVDNIEPVNQGIWKAAISTAIILKKKYSVTSELWFPRPQQLLSEKDFADVELKEIEPERSVPEFKINDVIILSHGAWRFPTKWANHLRKKGLPWIYNPQGMLEPWSRNQKPLRKWVYYHLIEKPMTQKASLIRAVGKPEFDNLSKSFNHVVLIPNGIDIPLRIPSKETIEPIQFLFMARLHHKKGIVPLVEGWIHSALKNHQGFRLVIAGPDQGELSKIMNLIQSSHTSNIVCKVAVYGEEKETLLQQSHFYVLPSFSEGFPTGVIEAMSRGLIPLISRGCNFPEAFNTQLAISAEPDSQKLIKSLEFAAEIDKNKYSLMSLNVYEFVKNHYSLEHIADMQSTLYKTLI